MKERRMKTLVRLCAIGLGFLVLSGISGCQNSVSPQTSSPTSASASSATRLTGQGSLALALGSAGRTLTIVPPGLDSTTVDHYDILLQRTGYPSVVRTGLTAAHVGDQIVLDSGDWSLTVKSYTAASVQNGQSGPDTVSIALGAVSRKTVTLAPYVGTGTGSLAVEFHWPVADVTEASLTLTSLPSGTAVDLTGKYTVSTATGTLSLTGTTGLPVGSYLLHLTLQNATVTFPPFTLAAQVFSGQTSAGTLTVTATDLTAAPLRATDFRVSDFDISDAGDPMLVFSWTDVALNETGYRVLDADRTELGTAGASVQTLEVPLSDASATYYLEVYNAYGTRESSCTFTEPSALTLSASTLTLTSTDPVTSLRATLTGSGTLGSASDVSKVKWTSSDPSVVEVDADTGAITPIAPGEAQVAAVLGTLSAICRVWVSPGSLEVTGTPPLLVTLSGLPSSFAWGTTGILHATVLHSVGTPSYLWSFDGVPVPGAVTADLPMIKTPSLGPHQVSVIVADGSRAASDSFNFTVNSYPRLTGFSFASIPSAITTVMGDKISVLVPMGTNTTSLVPTFYATGMNVTVGGVPQVSAVTANSFANPVPYTVSMGDGTSGVTTVSVGSTRWARTVTSSSGDSIFNAVGVDNSGNIVAAGSQYGTGTFSYGLGVSSSAAPSGPAVSHSAAVLYDRNGNPAIAKSVLADTAGSQFQSITVDPSGNTYAAGYLGGSAATLDFGNAISSTVGASTSAAIVSYSQAGVTLWAQHSAGTTGARFNGIVSSGAYVFAAGQIEGGNTIFVASPLTLRGATRDSAIVAYTASTGVANVALNPSAGSLADSYFNDLAVDGSGTITLYAVGGIAGTNSVTYGSYTVTGASGAGDNAFLVAFQSNGTSAITPQFAKGPVSAGSSSVFNGVAAEPVSSGKVYAVGSVNGTGTFNFGDNYVPAAVTVTGPAVGNNAVIVQYDSFGYPLWARTLTSASGPTQFNKVVADSSGNIYAVGIIGGTGTYDFGTGPFTTLSTGGNAVLVKYDSSGNPKWVKTVASGTAGTNFTDIALDGQYLVATGTIDQFNSATFDPGTVVANPYLSGKSSLVVQYAK